MTANQCWQIVAIPLPLNPTAANPTVIDWTPSQSTAACAAPPTYTWRIIQL